jgi:uncharacterized protein (TIGR03790 family)
MAFLVRKYINNFTVIFIILLCCATAGALEPEEILVVVNSDIEQSVHLGQYYCQKRNVPEINILSLSLGRQLTDSISRGDYDAKIAEPIRKRLAQEGPGKAIKCLLMTYGIPYKVGPRGQLKDKQERLLQLKADINQCEIKLSVVTDAGEKAKINKEIKTAQQELDWITGRETDASVDSELSMVKSDSYELYRWQTNQLYRFSHYPADLVTTIMVSRLDGPTPQIARGLIDKALSAERSGLHGAVYIDSRGLPDDKKPGSFGNFDQQVRDTAMLFRFLTKLEVKEERTEKLFEPNGCPRTVIYCGWYSLKKYVDSFDFVEGAIGYHIASFEAADIHDANSTQWCPAMLMRGVTATLGPVAEPYLHTFPRPNDFFLELLHGKCLVEAFYLAEPVCSWQLILIGDPLYTPFKSGLDKS